MTEWLGQEQPIAAFLSALHGERLHHGWLLAGPEGVGKGGLARAFATALLRETPPRDYADLCDMEAKSGDQAGRLVSAGTHPDLVILQRLMKDIKKSDSGELARNITVDQVRHLARFLHLAPSIARRRVVIIDTIDDMERGAANALLKNLEEPPRDTVFLLVSHMPGRLLPTIRSRCRMLMFHALGDMHMDQMLRAHAADLAPEERRVLIAAAQGSPGRALAVRALGLAELEQRLERIAATGDPDNAERIALARALSSKSAQARYEAMVDHIPHFIARRVRAMGGAYDPATVAAWEEAVRIGRNLSVLSLEPATTIFALAGTVARLAPKQA